MEGKPVGEQSDHDLLIRLDQRFDGLEKSIGDKFDALNRTLVEREQDADIRHADHESRLRTLEKRIWSIPALPTVISTAAFGLAVYDRMKG